MAGENGANDLSNQVQDLSVNPDAAGNFPSYFAIFRKNQGRYKTETAVLPATPAEVG